MSNREGGTGGQKRRGFGKVGALLRGLFRGLLWLFRSVASFTGAVIHTAAVAMILAHAQPSHCEALDFGSNGADGTAGFCRDVVGSLRNSGDQGAAVGVPEPMETIAMVLTGVNAHRKAWKRKAVSALPALDRMAREVAAACIRRTSGVFQGGRMGIVYRESPLKESYRVRLALGLIDEREEGWRILETLFRSHVTRAPQWRAMGSGTALCGRDIVYVGIFLSEVPLAKAASR